MLISFTCLTSIVICVCVDVVMTSHVIIQVTFLGKWIVANGTLMRSFTCVDSTMNNHGINTVAELITNIAPNFFFRYQSSFLLSYFINVDAVKI